MHTTSASVPAGLLLAEDVLSRMREAVRSTPVWEDSRLNTNEMLERGTSFANLRLDQDCTDDTRYLRFLRKHWDAADKKEQDPTGYFVARNAEPRSLALVVESRLAYLNALPALAQALDGLPVGLSETTSWRWDQSCRTKSGKPTHRVLHQLTVDFKCPRPLSARAWLKSAGAHLCWSLDTRADQCLFQALEDAGIETGGSMSLNVTRTGVEISCMTQAIAETIRTRLFSDCSTTYKPRKAKDDYWTLCVEFPGPTL